jgi:hypothetical protein
LALNGYNAAIGESSISGVSSGAFMAVQFGTAWSSVIKGVGVVAGGPFWCAEADASDIGYRISRAGEDGNLSLYTGLFSVPGNDLIKTLLDVVRR